MGHLKSKNKSELKLLENSIGDHPMASELGRISYKKSGLLFGFVKTNKGLERWFSTSEHLLLPEDLGSVPNIYISGS